jgi:hypothetical protein
MLPRLNPDPTAVVDVQQTARSRTGHIGLQCHTGNVQFQNVMIRSLPD